MVMMFLQFFIWGAWYATGGNYMKSRGMTDVIHLAYMLGTLAAGWMFNAIMPGASGPSALEQWQTFWIMPLVFAVIVTAMFVAGFREESPTRKTAVV